MCEQAFGDYIRSRREALRKDSSDFSIRKVAQRIGIHHSYLSKIERVNSLSFREKMVALAEELGDDPELLMAMNGKVSEEVRRAVFEDPEWVISILNQIKTGRNGSGM